MKHRKQTLLRTIVYTLGMFFLAVGVAFSVNSGLGVCPVNSIPFVLSKISGVTMGTCVTAVFTVYVLMQMLLLRNEFKAQNLLQLIFASIFGYFVDFSKYLLGDFTLPSYPGNLFMLSISIVFVALGLIFYLSAEIVPMPMEGMTLAMATRLKRFSFHNVKIAMDTVNVLVAAALSFAIDGHIEGLGEGTFIAAFACGKVMAVLAKFIKPQLQALWQPCTEELAASYSS